MKSLPVAIFLFLSLAASSQNVKVSMGINYGNYKMESMKKLQAEFLNQLSVSVPVSVIDNFPAFIGFEGSLLFNTGPGMSVGGFGGFNSTGSRLYYADYSGNLSFDQLVRSVSFGGLLEFTPSDMEGNRPKFLVTLKTGLSFNSYHLNYKLEVDQSIDKDVLDFNSTNLFLIPGIGVRKYIGNFFLQPEIRYHFDFPGDVYLASDSDAKLLTADGENVKIDWTGFRIALIIGFHPGRNPEP